MEVCLSASTAYSDLQSRLSPLTVLLLALILPSCSTKHVTVSGEFPAPLVEKLPANVGVIYPPEFINHEIYEVAQIEGDSNWRFSTGAAQVRFWSQFLSGFFENLIEIGDWDTMKLEADKLDGVLIPRITDLQYSVPQHTNTNIFEIQFFYEFSLVDPSKIYVSDTGALAFHPEDRILSWTLVSYGKTPSAFIQSAEEALNLAAIVSLRDGGANFAQNFVATPQVTSWLEQIQGTEQKNTLIIE